MRSSSTIQAFVITSVWEQNRKEQVSALKKALPLLESVEAIYPTYQKVPFLTSLQQKAKERGGRLLNPGEIGVLLSNRKIWRKILATATDDHTHYLILESDSTIKDIDTLLDQFQDASHQYDIFFWGGWMGHIKLKRSTATKVAAGITMGEPVWKTICSAYGYSINKKAAKLLLQYSAKMAYPVDEFKRYLSPGICRIGAMLPEIIAEGPGTSTIGHEGWNQTLEKGKMFLLDCRNSILAYCS